MNKKKMSLYLILIITLSMVNYVYGTDGYEESEGALIKGFNVTESELVQVNVKGNSKINEEFLASEDLIELANNLVNTLKIKGERLNNNNRVDINEEGYTLDIEDGDEQRQAIICGIDNLGNKITAIVTTYSSDEGEFKETDLFVELINRDTVLTQDKLNELEKNVDCVFKEFDVIPEKTKYIIGNVSGDIEDAERYLKVSKIISSIDGKKIEEYCDDDVISVSAYSHNIPKHIFTGDKKMNISIEIRYNEYEDKTYFWIGTPIIS